MSLKNYRTICLSIIFSIFISACGGGSSTPSTAPTAIITAESNLAEGIVSTPLDASNSSDSNGDVTSYLWAIDDNDGITDLAISDTSLILTELNGIPVNITGDKNIIVSLIVTDNDGEQSEKITKTITIQEANPVTFNTSDLNGTWYSPCFNTNNNTSIEQTLLIAGTSMTTEMSIYSAGSNPAFNCILPATSAGLIEAEGSTRLSFGNTSSQSGCVNGEAINTSVNISNIQVGSTNNTTTSDIDGALILLAANVDILPTSTEMCLLTNGNLLFAGQEYTPTMSTIIDNGGDLTSDVTWQVGNNNYFGLSTLSDNLRNQSFDSVSISTTGDVLNGRFSGSSLSLAFTMNGPGTYTVVSRDEARGAQNNTNELASQKVISIRTTVGTGVLSGTTFYDSSASTGTAVATIDSEGFYHFSTTAPVTISIYDESDGGVAGAPDEIEFTMSNVYQFPRQ